MSERFAYFEAPSGCTAVALPFDLEDMLAQWGALRPRMIRRMSPAFTREEWAYLITFLDPEHLRHPFTRAFGTVVAEPGTPITALARRRGPIALWLPNNVSLLGPLTVILLSLTGNPIRVKGGSHSEDLLSAFLAYVQEHDANSRLAEYLARTIRHEVFDRQDPRNQEMAAEATMRIVFGSDDAACQIHSLPHPLDSAAFSFSDRRSQVWLEAEAVTDEVLTTLIKVFAIYGQAGCTSPARVILLDHPQAAAQELRERMLALWPRTIPRALAPHLASGNVMARQWAAALGWDAALAAGNQAVLAVGDYQLEPVPAPLLLPVMAAPLDEAVAQLPPNIQTLGYALMDPASPRWLDVLARTSIKRFVPIQRMHHFGSIWDGAAFWQQAFEIVEIGGMS